MFQLPSLKSGDSVEIIAPASRCSDAHLIAIKELLSSWELNCRISSHIFAKDLLCANTDENRFNFLQTALEDSEVKAIICARGGYGSMRLIPKLTKLSPPSTPKLFIGMSDITALSLYFQQKWQWPTIHGALAVDKFSKESIATVKALMFGEIDVLSYRGVALNSQAKDSQIIDSTLCGGNLCLVQTSLGTLWQIDGDQKIIFLEEIGERGYRIDRMLEQLKQARIFQNAAAIVFGDFLNGEEPNGLSLVQPVLERFAQDCEIPVIQIQGIGHGYINYPLPLGTAVKLKLGDKVELVCGR